MSKKKKQKKVKSYPVMTHTLGGRQFVSNGNGDQFEVRLEVKAVRVDENEQPVRHDPLDEGITMPQMLDMATVVLLSIGREVGIDGVDRLLEMLVRKHTERVEEDLD